MAGVAGSERYLESILPELKKRGIEISFLIIQHPKNKFKNLEFANNLRQNDVTVFILNSYFPVSPWVIWKIAKLLKKESFKILYSNLIYSDLIAAIVKKFFLPSIKLLSVKHGYDEKFQTKYGLNYLKLKTSLFSIITKWSAKSADNVICISEALKDFFEKGGLIEPIKLITIPYGFNFSSIKLDPNIKDFQYGSPQIIVTGRLEEVKQHHLLIKCIPELLVDFPAISVIMVGDGSLASNLKSFGESLGVSESIKWLGFQKNVHNFIQASDIMIIPSSAEGFGLVVLESWFHAKPVIAFDVPAINEIIDHKKNGLLVKPFSRANLVKAIKSLLKDKDMLCKFGKAGQEKQKNIYDIKIMAKKTLSVLNELNSKQSLGNTA